MKPNLKQIKESILKNKIVKTVQEKIEFVNKLTEGKKGRGFRMDIKSHEVTKKWTPMEKKIFGIK
jgi:ribosomal protein L15E